MSVVYFDAAEKMLQTALESREFSGCHFAVLVSVTKKGNVLSAVCWDEDNPEPFAAVGALENVKREVMHSFIERSEYGG